VPVLAGFLWGLLLVAAEFEASALVAIVLAPVAVVATASGLRAAGFGGTPNLAALRPTTGDDGARVLPGPAALLAVGPQVLAMVAAFAAPFVALGGIAPGVVAVALFGGLALAAAWAGSPVTRMPAFVLLGWGPALAATCMVLARGQGRGEGLALAAAILAFDAGAFIMGHGRSALGGPLGTVFGFVCVAVVGIYVAAALNPPFTASRSVEVFALTAAGMVAGVLAISWAVGGQRLPALRRLDSAVLAAPLWVAAVAALPHH
jgi:hypothetical protein